MCIQCQNSRGKTFQLKMADYEEVLLRVCNDVNKTDRPNTTPAVRGICTFAVYFSIFRPFCHFTLVYEGHLVLCYKEKTRAVRSC